MDISNDEMGLKLKKRWILHTTKSYEIECLPKIEHIQSRISNFTINFEILFVYIHNRQR